MKKPIDVTLPQTLNIGLYAGKHGCTVYSTLRQDDGTILEDVYMDHGTDPWIALHDALDELQVLKAWRVAIFTNDAAVHEALSSPQVAPEPDKEVKDKRFGLVRYGGRAAHWLALICLTEYCRWGGWSVFLVSGDKLKRAKDYYDSCYENGYTGPPTASKAGVYREYRASLPAAGSEAKRWFEQIPLLDWQDQPRAAHGRRRTRRRPARAAAASV